MLEHHEGARVVVPPNLCIKRYISCPLNPKISGPNWVTHLIRTPILGGVCLGVDLRMDVGKRDWTMGSKFC
jgi:hypothetical protein